MVRVLFVCLGNICRSPMAEFMLKSKVDEKEFYIRSAGTSSEEEGNPVYPPARAELAARGIFCEGKRAAWLQKKDYENYDFILCMEQRNVVSARHIFGSDPQNKVKRLLDFSKSPRDIADPWYTGNFTRTYEDIEEGLEAFLDFLQSGHSGGKAK